MNVSTPPSGQQTSPLSTTEGTSNTGGGAGMTSSVVPFAITGGVLGLVFIVLVILALVALVRRKKALALRKASVPQQNDFESQNETVNQHSETGKPVVNPSYEGGQLSCYCLHAY